MTTSRSSGATAQAVAPEGFPDPERLEAMRGLEDAFSQLMTEWRRVYAIAAETAAPGLQPGSYKVLSVVARTGAITVSSLAEKLTADKGLTSRAVSELEDHGLVARTTDPADGRVRLIEITDVGQERLAAARAPYEQRLATTLGDWPVDTITRLTDLLQALAAGQVPAH